MLSWLPWHEYFYTNCNVYGLQFYGNFLFYVRNIVILIYRIAFYFHIRNINLQFTISSLYNIFSRRNRKKTNCSCFHTAVFIFTTVKQRCFVTRKVKQTFQNIFPFYLFYHENNLLSKNFRKLIKPAVQTIS